MPNETPNTPNDITRFRAAGVPAGPLPGAVRVDTEALKWTDFPEGNARFVLLSIDPTSGGWTGILKFPPGQKIQMHHHAGGVEVYNISGDWSYTEGGMGPGYYMYEPAGVIHEPQIESEVTMFVVVRGSIVYFDDDGNFESFMDAHMLYTLVKNNGAADHLKHFDALMVERPLAAVQHTS
ncbi:2,4'-dihydroxyacetophenone dioxygenase family protein [Pseudonocardia sp.]|uniref:2,4'-dihydroxyacetophenone dioxygenase family protein n=1 Tax=Pseudonocardia sp. TaxID=60912 RepID=UPI003D0F993A